MGNGDLSKMARFISELRKEKGLTQKELAERLGVTDKAVSKWERGLSCPDISLLSRLSQVLGITTGELLSGERADPPAPEVEAMIQATLQYADTATRGRIAASTRWKHVAMVALVLLLGIVVVIGGSSAIDGGLGWAFLPLNITCYAWLALIVGAFIIGKNKLGSAFVCGFLLYMTTFYYSSLNEAPAGVTNSFIGFPRSYIPHYTAILVMFIVSVVVVAVSSSNQKISGDGVFLLAAVSITVILLSILTVPSIMDYVDINHLGVDARFTILMWVTLLVNCVSLVLLAKRHKRQIVDTTKAGSN